ncbi:MAG TPA: hypothetical protein VJ501_01165 [Burkholderiaceae bacterium]|nr:hypothetical protein [Burkholderiaceae bacterium]
MTGASINFASNGGDYMGVMDAGWIKQSVDKMIKAQGATKMKYVSASIPTFTR